MNDPSSPSPPRWVWRLIGLGVGLVPVVTAAGAILLGLGAADPPVAGPITWEDGLMPWAGGPELRLDAGAEAWFAAPDQAALPPSAFTLAVQARLAADSGGGASWGVWLATRDGGRAIYAISGEGYTTTRQCPPGDLPAALEDCPALRPEWRWFAYPRIHPPGESNNITLHREPSGEVRLRLNDERMGVAPVEMRGAWGVWARGGRDGGAVLRWEGATRRG